MIHPTFPNFKPMERVALRMPMERYQFDITDGLKSGDMLYVVKQDHFETRVEEARTGFHFTVQTLDLEPWTR
jgi:hypothetical protein